MIPVYQFAHPNSYDQNIKSCFRKKSKVNKCAVCNHRVKQIQNYESINLAIDLKHLFIKSIMFIGLIYYEIKRVLFAKVKFPYFYKMHISDDPSEESDQ